MGVKGGWSMGVVMAVAVVVMTRGERVVECEEEEVHKMQDNFVNCTQHFKQEYNVQVLKKAPSCGVAGSCLLLLD